MANSAPSYQQVLAQTMAKAQKLLKSPMGAANTELDPQSIVDPMQNSYVNPGQVAHDAGLQYDTQINQLQGNYGTTQRQNAQDLQNIMDWYNQAGQTQAQGAADNAATLAQQLAGQDSAAHGLLAAIGGSANAGASGIVNANDIASAGLRSLGQVQSNFDNNMKGVIGLDAATQKQNEQTAGTNRLQAIMNQIASAKSDQTAAEATARDAARSQLFDQKGTVANLLSNLQGNLFNEKMGVRQQRLSELGTISNQALSSALAGPQITGAKLQNQMTRGDIQARSIQNKQLNAQTKAYVKSQKNSAGGATWANAPLSVTNGMRQQILSHGGDYFKANGQLKMPPGAVRAALTRQFKELGFKSDASMNNYINQMFHTMVTPAAVKAWNQAHGTHYALRNGHVVNGNRPKYGAGPPPPHGASRKAQMAWIRKNAAYNLKHDKHRGPGGADVAVPSAYGR